MREEEAVVYCIEKYIFNKKLKLRKNPTNKYFSSVLCRPSSNWSFVFFLKAQLWQPLRRRQWHLLLQWRAGSCPRTSHTCDTAQGYFVVPPGPSHGFSSLDFLWKECDLVYNKYIELTLFPFCLFLVFIDLIYCYCLCRVCEYMPQPVWRLEDNFGNWFSSTLLSWVFVFTMLCSSG